MAAPEPKPGLRPRPHPLDDPSPVPAPVRAVAPTTPTQALNAKIPADLHRRLRVAAASEGRTVVSILVELLTDWLNRRDAETERKS
jgi:hypothetical protein